MVRLHLFFPLNGVAAPLSCSRMVPAPLEITTFFPLLMVQLHLSHAPEW